jgi:ABC-2 type transport system ATP-binding protein
VAYGAHVVLSNLDFTAEPARVHGLVGRNGAGKTTLLEAIYGFVRRRAGDVLVQSRAVRRGDIGYLPTDLVFYPRITGREYLRVFRGDRLSINADAWADALDVPMDECVDTYSFGARRKLALIGVLSLGRPVLMLDEPGSGLDLESHQILTHLVRDLAQRGVTVVVTSPVLESLQRMCDQIHLLDAGRVRRTYCAAEFELLRADVLSGSLAQRIDAAHRALTYPSF